MTKVIFKIPFAGAFAARSGSAVGSLSKLGESFGNFLQAETLIWFCGKISLAVCVFLFGDALDAVMKLDIQSQDWNPPQVTSAPGLKPAKESFKIVSTRNIFGSKPVETVAAPTDAVKSIKLRLVGSHVGPKSEKFAIIEDTAKNDQDVFSLGDMVFNQAKLVEIAPEQVKVEYGGKSEILRLEEATKAAAPEAGEGETAAPEDDQSEFSVDEKELSDALANLPMLLSQARAVPYFRNGQSIGMRLFAIRSGSLYEKLGLKNGDIVTNVNEAALNDPSQALKLFEQLKNERSITVKMERNGVQRELQYTIR